MLGGTYFKSTYEALQNSNNWCRNSQAIYGNTDSLAVQICLWSHVYQPAMQLLCSNALTKGSDALQLQLGGTVY